MVGIYKIENLVNGKVYIGQSKDISHRWILHRSELKHNHHGNIYLQNSWNKYGEQNFVFDLVEECVPDALDELEIKWIDYYKSYLREFGYNVELGGHVNTFYKPVLQFSLDGEYISEWKSARDASIHLDINIQTIINCCNKTYKYGSGYIWIYKENYSSPDDLKWYLNRRNMRRVLQYDRNANIVNVWENGVRDANRHLGYNIIPCLTHVTSTTNGYVFIYEDENIKVDKEYCDHVFSLLNNISNRPFYCLSPDGEIVKRYNSLREAEVDGYHEKMVNDCVRGLRDKYKKHLWVYVDEYSEDKKQEYIDWYNRPTRVMDYPILQYKDGVLVKRYEHLKDVEKEYNKSSVSECCKSRKPQYKGYTWKYEIKD